MTTAISQPTNRHEVEMRQWHERCLWLLFAVFLCRLAYLAIVPVDLVPDEAYYWDWSRHLDYGYYSKPPLIAWLIAASTSIFGNVDWAVRLPAVFCSTLALLFGYLLTQRMFDARVGFWGVVLAIGAPGSAALGMFMTIDAPLLCCWCAALYAFWRLLERKGDWPWWWAASVLSVGIGLLAKQTMLCFLPLAGLFILISPDHRRELSRASFWLWGLASVVFLAPVLYWNSQHGWITLEHTRGHFGAKGETSLAKHAVWGLEFLASQAGVVSPLTWLLFIIVLTAAVLMLRRLAPRERYLVAFSALPLLGVAILSFLQRVQPNWPAPFYVSGLILVVAWGLAEIQITKRIAGWRKAFAPAMCLGLATCVLTYAMPFAIDWLGLTGGRLDPTVRLRGWRELAMDLELELQQFPDPEKTLFIAATSRTECGPLAFYLPSHPQIYRWNPGHVDSQYDIWGGPRGKEGWDAFILTPQRSKVPPELAQAFLRVEKQREVCVEIGNGRTHHYQIWKGCGLRQWPTDRRRAAEAMAGQTGEALRR